MKRIYFCPACRANLNPSRKIILAARKGKVAGLVLLSPQPGNYDAVISEELDLKPHDLVDFHCPVCGASLVSRVDHHLAVIGFRMTNGTEGWANFARRFGEHASFFIAGEEVRSYGEDASHYGRVNFFGAGQGEVARK